MGLMAYLLFDWFNNEIRPRTHYMPSVRMCPQCTGSSSGHANVAFSILLELKVIHCHLGAQHKLRSQLKQFYYKRFINFNQVVQMPTSYVSRKKALIGT